MVTVRLTGRNVTIRGVTQPYRSTRTTFVSPSGTAVVALERFERRRDPHTRGWSGVLPVDPGVIHAVHDQGLPRRRPGPEFFDAPGLRAVCGVSVMVRLPMDFKVEEDGACLQCTVKFTQLAELWGQSAGRGRSAFRA